MGPEGCEDCLVGELALDEPMGRTEALQAWGPASAGNLGGG